MAEGSEVARLLRQIDEEYAAGQRGLTGIAMTARHQFITARMERIWDHMQALIEEVGPEKAGQLLSGNAQEAQP